MSSYAFVSSSNRASKNGLRFNSRLSASRSSRQHSFDNLAMSQEHMYADQCFFSHKSIFGGPEMEPIIMASDFGVDTFASMAPDLPIQYSAHHSTACWPFSDTLSLSDAISNPPRSGSVCACLPDPARSPPTPPATTASARMLRPRSTTTTLL